MGYVVRKLPYKSRQWKVQYQDRTKGRDAWRDIPETEYRRLGFVLTMTVAEAQVRRDQLNAQLELKRIEAKRATIAKAVHEKDLAHLAYLDASDVAAFEAEVLYARIEEDRLRKNKVSSHWRAARECICALKLDTAEWARQAPKFYDYFKSRKWSPSYVQKVLPIMNRWAEWQSYKYKTFWKPLPMPRGLEMERIADTYFDKRPKGMKSAVLTPAALEKARESLDPPVYRWLALSVWFGLRPPEVDQISAGKNFEVVTVDGVKVLRVYQTKLVRVPRPERWKFIPCYHPEQVEALKAVEERLPIETPGAKLLASRFGEQTYLYAGRKGFQDLMLGLGHPLEDISTWLGHMSIDRTWRDYKNRLSMKVKRLPSMSR